MCRVRLATLVVLVTVSLGTPGHAEGTWAQCDGDAPILRVEWRHIQGLSYPHPLVLPGSGCYLDFLVGTNTPSEVTFYTFVGGDFTGHIKSYVQPPSGPRVDGPAATYIAGQKQSGATSVPISLYPSGEYWRLVVLAYPTCDLPAPDSCGPTDRIEYGTFHGYLYG